MTHIYGLGDPHERRIRYIGKTNDIDRRYKEHIEDNADTPKCHWIKQLQAQGHQPYIVRLDSCNPLQANSLEKWWIQFGEKKGWELTNSTFVKRSHPYRSELFYTFRLAAALVIILLLLYATIGR